VPFAVKNLFDVKGLTTLAGSKINRELPPCEARCTADRTARGGGVRCSSATLNMDEYATLL